MLPLLATHSCSSCHCWRAQSSALLPATWSTDTLLCAHPTGATSSATTAQWLGGRASAAASSVVSPSVQRNHPVSWSRLPELQYTAAGVAVQWHRTVECTLCLLNPHMRWEWRVHPLAARCVEGGQLAALLEHNCVGRRHTWGQVCLPLLQPGPAPLPAGFKLHQVVFRSATQGREARLRLDLQDPQCWWLLALTAATRGLR